ncbi:MULTISPECIES: WhiB family transcriptional regulator [unclassified Rhodococcus (in: high G+C Gram-positive bacteria)]|uniref:WhiB family transcriptional regulator n=1 Tax=unclassified Rhodococcus (in: high G+C Gram-positive bacteria) TaxID=192944 RepID=UPI00163A0704|nr:WhiB family transcriptional regulator [Rhodococcus sp. 3A]MBC2892645.1 WhiB family transcriptional regulator [Rhodococcus sp. 4CII]
MSTRNANCRNADPRAFFASADENRSAGRDRERGAKRLCLHCPVQIDCRRHALSIREGDPPSRQAHPSSKSIRGGLQSLDKAAPQLHCG